MNRTQRLTATALLPCLVLLLTGIFLFSAAASPSTHTPLHRCHQERRGQSRPPTGPRMTARGGGRPRWPLAGRLRPCREVHLWDRFTMFEQTRAVGANSVGCHVASLLERTSLGIAAWQGRYRDQVFTLRPAFDDHRELMYIHRSVPSALAEPQSRVADSL